VLLDSDVVKLVLNSSQRSADSRRPGTDDQDIVNARGRLSAAACGHPASDGVDAVAPLIDGVLDQSQPTEFASGYLDLAWLKREAGFQTSTVWQRAQSFPTW